MQECCGALQDMFDDRTARRQLRRYRRRGAARSTRLLLEALQAAGPGESLLDIGGGVGVIQDSLLRDGVRFATAVDASAAYIAAAEELAVERGYRDRLQVVHADFVGVGSALPDADTVTLDRVICCYPDMESLVALSAARARRLYGIVVPRENLLSQVGVRIGNAFLKLSGNAFRAYIHPLARIEAIVRAAGLRPVSARQTGLWSVRTYSRKAGGGSERG